MLLVSARRFIALPPLFSLIYVSICNPPYINLDIDMKIELLLFTLLFFPPFLSSFVANYGLIKGFIDRMKDLMEARKCKEMELKLI